jgi:hypothetical protein
MRPEANLNFSLVATDGMAIDNPGPLVWASGNEPWELPYSSDVISARPYIRSGVLLLTFRPWGLVILNHRWPVMYAPDESSEYLFKCAFTFGGGVGYSVAQAREDLYKEAAKVMHKAVHLIAAQSPDLLTPRIVAELTKRGLPLGTVECRTSEQLAESTPSTPARVKGGGRKKGTGKTS